MSFMTGSVAAFDSRTARTRPVVTLLLKNGQRLLQVQRDRDGQHLDMADLFSRSVHQHVAIAGIRSA